MDTPQAPQNIAAIIAMRPGLTQKALASEVGCSEYWLSVVVRGKERPSLRLKAALSAALDEPVEQLFREEPEPVAS